MTTILENLQFLRIGWTDLLEIVIVAFLLYRVLLVLQRTRAMQIILGLAILGSLYGLSRLLDLILIRTLLETSFQYGAIAALVVFQPELRVALARLGQSRMVRAFQRLERTCALNCSKKVWPMHQSYGRKGILTLSTHSLTAFLDNLLNCSLQPGI